MDKANALDVIKQKVEHELIEMSNVPLTSSNLDIHCKLLSMYVNLIELSELQKCSCDTLYGMDSEQKYLDAKTVYRKDHSTQSKNIMIHCLEELMLDLNSKLREYKRDSDIPEERDIIKKYLYLIDN